MFEQIQKIYELVRETNDEPQEEPGLDRTAIARRLEAEGIPCHPLLLDLYSWRNGIWHVNGFLHFVSLDYAIERYRSVTKYPDDSDPNWFPILDLNGDVLFCLNLETDALVEVDLEAQRNEVLAQKASHYLAAVIDVLKDGSATYDETGGLFEVTNESGWQAAMARHRIKSAWR
jgi:hypothetical protein